MMKWWAFGAICGMCVVIFGSILLSIITWIAKKILETIQNFQLTIPYIPLCIEYKINPFRTRLTEICGILDTEEKREKWLTVTNEKYKRAWKNLFRQYPIEPTEEELEELRKELNKKVEEF